MLNLTVLIPVESQEEGIRFYRDLIGFEETSDGLVCPFQENGVVVNLINVHQETREKYALPEGKIRFPLFRYQIEDNFLSYCKKLVDANVRFDLACEHPGGYFARIIDPFCNTFEVTCDSFEDAMTGSDAFADDFFKRY